MTPGSRESDSVVIVGASAAGLAAADGLREGGFEGSIIVLGSELHHPYDRPTLSKGLLLEQGDPQLLELRSAERIRDNRIDLRLGRKAVGLDIDRKYVITNNGEALPWDAVVLACGGRPRQLITVEGEVLPALRTPDDLRDLRQAAARYGEVTVVGAGLIGLEIAAGLCAHGIAVTVLHDTERPMDGIVGPELGQTISDLHSKHGVQLKMSSAVQFVTGGRGAYTLHLANGSTHQAPYVVTGIGVEPDVDWLLDSGVALDRGVLTDAAGSTNVPGVWAAGDVARSVHPLFGEPLRIEHWTHAVEKGRHVGLNISRGTTAPFCGVPYFWSDQYGRRFHCYGRRGMGDAIFVAEGALTDDEFLVLFGRDGEFHCVFACGLSRSLRDYRKLLARGGTWDEALDLARKLKPDMVCAVPR
ncbi:NAD(P)/FAD-dependent oxidoreductase [Mycolicibacterium sp. CBMA 226]|uniref:NAD(P)/FAD-dependent oxidoreductase n=1 Tax=Mycolicibacterium sp. CBMA 226 TaxID=2606611 RepID=UPI0012DDD385|nr:FAD-dependent oxidoreductase [Mycolicibacterium sp. CBMA 226]QGW61291.1 Rhodocoxin reductase [Mycolicibacterium sp.]